MVESSSPSPSTPQLTDLQAKLDTVLRQVESLAQQNASLLEELREMRRENTMLRRQLDEARRTVHQPYAVTAPLSSPSAALPLAPVGVDGELPMVVDSPERPPPVRPAVRGLRLEDDPAHGF